MQTDVAIRVATRSRIARLAPGIDDDRRLAVEGEAVAETGAAGEIGIGGDRHHVGAVRQRKQYQAGIALALLERINGLVVVVEGDTRAVVP